MTAVTDLFFVTAQATQRCHSREGGNLF